jgi:hypothetical protein
MLSMPTRYWESEGKSTTFLLFDKIILKKNA